MGKQLEVDNKVNQTDMVCLKTGVQTWSATITRAGYSVSCAYLKTHYARVLRT